MEAYDKNHDGRIDVRELAQLLPLEDGFKLLFNIENQVESSVEFMRVSEAAFVFFSVSSSANLCATSGHRFGPSMTQTRAAS